MFVNHSSESILEIMALDNKIRQAGIHHNHSKITGEIDEEFLNCIDNSKLIQSNTSSLSGVLVEKCRCSTHYAMAKSEKMIQYTFALNDHDLLLVSTDPDANSDLVISRIIDFLKYHV